MYKRQAPVFPTDDDMCVHIAVTVTVPIEMDLCVIFHIIASQAFSEMCIRDRHNVLCYAIKVTKKKLKITVKQWSVSFLVYRGRFAPLCSVFFDTTNFRRMGESGNR